MMKITIYCLFLLLKFIITTTFIYPEDLAENLLKNISAFNSSKEITLLFTGDTQYHFPCVSINQQCKERSKNCSAQTNTKNTVIDIKIGASVNEMKINYFSVKKYVLYSNRKLYSYLS
ncbi:unnamed protein product [Meloidogyne enterolobii]|uniref:Uncharacterized protein n=2 Tax=Meloidogyne enterolobii TaxID=390850 RepID=A0ACB0ZWK5_MELEN|nr:unnamed protein product [Meloidogyne enterolobii]